MRIAVISDIHANLQAWNAVLLDIRSLKADMIICLGDVVGYGPNPAETLAAAYRQVNHFVLGNHDAALAGKLDPDLFNPAARAMLEWTRTRVGDNARRFFDRVPLILAAGLFRCAHGDLAAPEQFNYVIDPADALPSWKAFPEQLLFTGHTHQPCIFIIGQSGTPHRIEPADFELEAGKRYLVNVGSVGQPRDGDARAGYCLLDTMQNALYWRRIPFDIDAYRSALRSAGLDECASYFLHHDPRAAVPPLRELLDFNPPLDPRRGAQGVAPMAELQLTRHRLTRWRRVAAILVLGIVLAAAAGAWRLYREQHRVLRLTGDGFASIATTTAACNTNLLHDLRRITPGDKAPRGWKIEIGDRYSQAVEFGAAGDDCALQLRSAKAASPIRIIAPSVTDLKPDMKLVLNLLCRKSADFKGSVAAIVALHRSAARGDAITENFVVKEPELPRAGNWLLAQKTFLIPANGKAVQLEVRAVFSGILDIKAITLERKGNE